MHVLVMAKSPVPGRVKTRLCPPLTPCQAATLAEAALADTLEAVAQSGADRRMLALDGAPGPWLPSGFEVFPQRGRGLEERLAAAWHHAGGPGLQIGMDTPQVTAELLDHCLGKLAAPEVSAVLGPATDGGWWAIGLMDPHPAVFRGIAMSTATTGAAQACRLRALGRPPVILPALCDVDDIGDAAAVAALAPSSRFADSYGRMMVDEAS